MSVVVHNGTWSNSSRLTFIVCSKCFFFPKLSFQALVYIIFRLCHWYIVLHNCYFLFQLLAFSFIFPTSMNQQFFLEPYVRVLFKCLFLFLNVYFLFFTSQNFVISDRIRQKMDLGNFVSNSTGPQSFEGEYMNLQNLLKLV